MVNIPAIPNNVYASLEASLESPLSPFELARENRYLYYYNTRFNQLQYDSSLYQNSQDYSERFLSHLLDVASFVKRFSSSEKKIVEIGCGKGGFFNVLSQQGFSNLSGFDAAYEGCDPRIEKRYFSDEDKGFNAEIIIMRHTLEHIPSPFQFLRSIIATNSNPNASIVIEVPCFDWIVKHQAWWDLSYEHCNYFSEESFRSAFPNSIIKKVFDDQYLLVKADSADFLEFDNIPSQTYDDIKLESLFPFFQMRGNGMSDLHFWNQSYFHGRYWVWGCATKGVLLLFHMKQLFSDYHPPEGCIDINPSKQSKYLPSLGYRVMHPEFLYSHLQDGDTIIVSNPAYHSEIESMVSTNTRKKFNLVSI